MSFLYWPHPLCTSTLPTWKDLGDIRKQARRRRQHCIRKACQSEAAPCPSPLKLFPKVVCLQCPSGLLLRAAGQFQEIYLRPGCVFCELLVILSRYLGVGRTKKYAHFVDTGLSLALSSLHKAVWGKVTSQRSHDLFTHLSMAHCVYGILVTYGKVLGFTSFHSIKAVSWWGPEKNECASSQTDLSSNPLWPQKNGIVTPLELQFLPLPQGKGKRFPVELLRW